MINIVVNVILHFFMDLSNVVNLLLLNINEYLNIALKN